MSLYTQYGETWVMLEQYDNSSIQDHKKAAKVVVEALEGLLPVKVHCSVLAEEAVKTAVADYYNKIGRPVDFEIEKSHEEE